MNEYEWAENALKNKHLGKKPTETIGRIAKYYFYIGKSRPYTKSKIIDYILSCDDQVNIVSWDSRIDSAIKYASKHPLIIMDDLIITKNEMGKIKSLSGIQLQRLAFTLLCISKFSHKQNPLNDYWVNIPDNEIMRMANVNTSIKRQSAMYYALSDNGLIRFSNSVDKLSVQVLFVEENDDECLRVKDMRNLGYQYMKYLGSDYYICTNCGITFKGKNSNSNHKPKYCDDCAAKIRTKQQVESVMRRRIVEKTVQININ